MPVQLRRLGFQIAVRQEDERTMTLHADAALKRPDGFYLKGDKANYLLSRGRLSDARPLAAEAASEGRRAGLAEIASEVQRTHRGRQPLAVGMLRDQRRAERMLGITANSGHGCQQQQSDEAAG